MVQGVRLGYYRSPSSNGKIEACEGGKWSIVMAILGSLVFDNEIKRKKTLPFFFLGSTKISPLVLLQFQLCNLASERQHFGNIPNQFE